MEITFSPIGIIHSCFKEKFGIPRQAGLVDDAIAEIELYPPYDREETLKGLEGFSHIWVIFIFHDHLGKGWKPMVRPPRLGGNHKMGVFATRSGFRPNPIGLSAVKLTSIKKRPKKVTLNIKGVDFLDKTPVLDIKPYLPYADAIDAASGGYASKEPACSLKVEFSPEALLVCLEKEKKGIPNFKRFIRSILENDPRPAYYSHNPQPRKQFGIRVFDVDVKWKIEGEKIIVTTIQNLTSATKNFLL